MVSWNWPGFEGKDIQVKCIPISDGQALLNKKLIGEQATTEEQQFKATFALPYAPGVIRAAGVTDEKK